MISIVVPVFNEKPNLEKLISEIFTALPAGEPCEVIFADDGSTDGTGEELERLKQRFGPRLIRLRLSRRYGQSAALAAGIDQSRGEIIVTMDGDGQNNPEDIPELLRQIRRPDCDAVCGWRKERRDGFLRTALSRWANRFVNSITGISLHDYGCTLRAYKRPILQEANLMGDMHRLLPAYLAWKGARLAEIPVSHRPRSAGQSKYGTFSRLLKVLLDAFLLKFYFSYFTRPMHFFGSAALGCLAAAGAIEAFVMWRRMQWGGDWMSPLFFLGLFAAIAALLLLFLGAIADLMVRNYMTAHGFKPYHLKDPSHEKNR